MQLKILIRLCGQQIKSSDMSETFKNDIFINKKN